MRKASRKTNWSSAYSSKSEKKSPLMILLPLLAYDEDHNLIGGRMLPIALVCSVVGFIGFLMVRFLVTERVKVEKKTEKKNYAETIKGFFTNVPMMALTIVSFVQVVCFMSMTPVNNITRFAVNAGYKVSHKPAGDDFEITISK